MRIISLIFLWCASITAYSEERHRWFSIGLGLDTVKVEKDVSRELRIDSSYLGASLNVAITPVKYVSIYSQNTSFSLVSNVLHSMDIIGRTRDAIRGEKENRLNIGSKALGISARYPLENQKYIGFFTEKHRWRFTDKEDDSESGKRKTKVVAKGEARAYGLAYIKDHKKTTLNMGVKFFDKKTLNKSFFLHLNRKF